MNCPRDNAVLSSIQKGRLEVNVCESCYGFSVLLKQEAAGALERQLSSALSKIGAGNEVETLKSPYTEEAMKRFLYRGIQLDYCSETHSVWFDRGEYSKMFQSPESKTRKPPSTWVNEGSPARETVGKSGDLIVLVGEVLSAIF